MEQHAGRGIVRLSPVAARLVGSDAGEVEQLDMLCGGVPLDLREKLTVICLLNGSRNPRVREAALRALRAVDVNDLAEFLIDPELHPRFLDLIVRVHAGNPVVTEIVTWHPAILEPTREFLARFQGDSGAEQFKTEAPVTNLRDLDSSDEQNSTEDGPATEVDAAAVNTAYRKIKNLGIGERIKQALTGDKEWRTILIKDTIKPVCCAVLKNPRITEAEVLAIARTSVQYDDIIRLICANREWLKKYPIRKALVENHRTPLPVALKLLATLGEKDLSAVAKSKNISSVLSAQARKMVLAKKQR